MDINSPYVSLSDAETVNAGGVEWDAASADDKNEALQYGRAYIDANYSLSSYTEDTAPDPLKIANAFMANEYLKDNAIFDQKSGHDLQEKEVEADGVRSKKVFNTRGSSDRFPKITAILVGYAVYTNQPVLGLMRV